MSKKSKTNKSNSTKLPMTATPSTSLAPIDPMAAYMAELKKYKVLSKEEEHELAVHYYKTGDSESAHQLVTSNLRFVVKIAAEYSKFGAKLIDLVQEGNVGLMHAVREFNPYKGVKLITYAVWWIRGYIQDYLMKQYSMVRIGTTQKQRKLFYQLQKQKEEMDRLGPSTVIKQLSGKLEIPENEVSEMSQRVVGRDVSLNQPLSEGDRSTLIDLQSDDDQQQTDDLLIQVEEIEQLKEVIEKLRPQLNDKELFLLDQRLLSDAPLTLQEIGESRGVSREAVRQMEVRLINKIKKELEEKPKDIND
ncbi:MAG: RNA polymerase factor sigma-32 [Bdellovibrionales bacterium]|nr:RNA polymerase factor sigma-32 [Bdellovibrionales bacterium]